MKSRPMTFADLALVASTRAMLAFGAGLLFANTMPSRTRRRVGIPLITLGIASTVPLLWYILRKPTLSDGKRHPELSESVVD